MNKYLNLFLIVLLIISASQILCQNSYGVDKNLPVIYISSDKIISDNADKALLNAIKNNIKDANVIIDPKSPNPGEVPRAIQNAPGGIAAYIAAADPGTMNELVYDVKKGYLVNDAKKLDGIVFINDGSVDLEETDYLPRAFDDNYSNPYFAGIYNPAEFLKSSGIILIQPNVGTSTQKEKINKISSSLINTTKIPGKNHLTPNYNSGLVAYHQINPQIIALGSQNVLNKKEPNIGYSRWMYFSSQYVSGYPIKNNTIKFSNEKVSGDSYYFGVVTVEEYRKIGKAVSEYMEKNKEVPQSINVDGRNYKKADLEYLFAELTYDHTSSKNMTFPRYIFINKASEPFDIITKYIKSSIYHLI